MKIVLNPKDQIEIFSEEKKLQITNSNIQKNSAFDKISRPISFVNKLTSFPKISKDPILKYAQKSQINKFGLLTRPTNVNHPVNQTPSQQVPTKSVMYG